MDDDQDRLSFLGFSCPERLRLRTVILQPGDSLEFRPADWLGALAIVERGELEVECCSGTRARFREGSVLAFTTLPLRSLHNAGDGPLVLSTLSRAGLSAPD
jgi:hypothetical protein